MTDLALLWQADRFGADLALDGGSLVTDDGLRTAIVMSLFTDARALDDDPLPAPEDRRGWWGDALPQIQGDRIGSRLWLLSREKRLASVLERARGYAVEALNWLIEDGIATAVDVSAEVVGDATLGLQVIITRPAGPRRQHFDFVWEATV